MKYSLGNFGLRVSFDELLNQFKQWEWKRNTTNSLANTGTSLSDGTEYVDICRDAFLSDSVFKKYKACIQYREILEHCTYELGLEYLLFIRNNEQVMTNLADVNHRESGNPFRYFYPGIGRVSPTQIRYAKVFQDLTHLFGSLETMQISEIGVGFGGQASQILNAYSNLTYRLFDLEWPALLSRKNIGLATKKSNNSVVIADWELASQSDLLISNYAFSELTRVTQDIYVKNVIKNSKRGYIIFNHLHDPNSDSYTADEFAASINGAQILKESPLTHPGNVLIVWGHKKESLREDGFWLANTLGCNESTQGLN